MARVLIADDDVTVREVLAKTLEAEGLSVDTVDSGWQAIKFLCRATADDEPYDAMVLDIIMPVVDGWQVLEAVRNNPLWRDLPVVAVSGYANGSSDVARISGYGCFFVEKRGDFLDVVSSALGRLVVAA